MRGSPSSLPCFSSASKELPLAINELEVGIEIEMSVYEVTSFGGVFLRVIVEALEEVEEEEEDEGAVRVEVLSVAGGVSVGVGIGAVDVVAGSTVAVVEADVEEEDEEAGTINSARVEVRAGGGGGVFLFGLSGLVVASRSTGPPPLIGRASFSSFLEKAFLATFSCMQQKNVK